MAHVEPGDAHDEMREADCGEAPCRPGGNYGLCRTHPTCAMVHDRLKAAEAQRETLRGALEEIATILARVLKDAGAGRASFHQLRTAIRAAEGAARRAVEPQGERP